MKKLNKKIICFLAVLLIAIILAIVITTNIVKKNQLENGEYLATTANADSTLLANYIKKGITIGGITGTLESLNTFDATAKAEDIMEGKTAYVKGEKITGTMKEKNPDDVPETEIYEGYYADIDGNGSVDGFIYADLAIGGTGEWNTEQGYYSIPKVNNLKEYYISQRSYNGPFGIKDVISARDSSGAERFYVMSLEDYSDNTYYWYYAAKNTMNDFNTATSTSFGEGKTNSTNILNRWKDYSYGYSLQNNDIWKYIENDINDGWFIPSKEEWAAFADRLDINTSIYKTYGLKDYYWSSSQANTQSAYVIYLNYGAIDNGNVDTQFYVRLSTTF